VSETTQANDGSLTDDERWADAVKRAQAGDKEAAMVIRDFLADRPGLVRACHGDLAETVTNWMVGTFCGKDLVRTEAIRARLNEMENDLAGPAPTPLESLLVQRVLICWLRLHLAEFNAGTCGTDSTTEAFQRQLERANRLFQSSVKMLATVRRMAMPILVGVNVTAGTLSGQGEPALPLKIRGTARTR
jgi:hypothetical protein